MRRGIATTLPAYGRWFGPGWYGRHPGAWRARRWARRSVWAVAAWATLPAYWGWAAGPAYNYDYGTTIVYEGDAVYYGDEQVGTAEQYYDQAAEIAQQGAPAAVQVDEEEQWESLGVFALAQDGDSNADKILQLAVNKQAVIRGNHYDALTETTLPVQGYVDKKTQRAAWTVGDNQEIVYEAGIYNLTEEEAPLLIHFGKDRTQQWMLVRLEEPEGAETEGAETQTQ